MKPDDFGEPRGIRGDGDLTLEDFLGAWPVPASVGMDGVKRVAVADVIALLGAAATRTKDRRVIEGVAAVLLTAAGELRGLEGQERRAVADAFTPGAWIRVGPPDDGDAANPLHEATASGFGAQSAQMRASAIVLRYPVIVGSPGEAVGRAGRRT